MARAALDFFGTTTRRHPITCFDGPEPFDDLDRDEAAEILCDFSCDLRHLLDQHDLTIEKILATPPSPRVSPQTADLHYAARLAWACIEVYAQTAGLDFAELTLRGRGHYAIEKAEQAAADIPAVDPVPAVASGNPRRSPALFASLSNLHDRYLWSVLRLVRRLSHWIR
jgi:hypothetical protein